MNGVHLCTTAGVFGAVAIVVGGAASTARAELAHPLQIQVWTGGNLSWSGTPAGHGNTTTPTVQYEGEVNGSGWDLEWNLLGDADPFVIGNMSITNNSNATQVFGLMVTQPIFPALTPSSLLGGSIQGGLTADGDGGTLSSVAGTPIYQAMIDGGFVGAIGNLLVDPISVSAGAFGSTNFASESFGGMPMIPSEPGPAVFNSIGILLTFSLTAGDTASFTSIFVAEQIPSPAPIALLGLAGLGAMRRRR